jgi:hypothetical protein
LRAGVKLKGMNSQVTRLSPSHDQSLPRLGFIQMRNDVISQIILLSFFPSFPSCTGCLPLPVSLYQFPASPPSMPTPRSSCTHLLQFLFNGAFSPHNGGMFEFSIGSGPLDAEISATKGTTA